MHENELDIDVTLIRKLLTQQFPYWSKLPLKPVPSAGTDNALYRLGNDMVIRLPRIDDVAISIRKEYEWLPKIASYLPVAIPTLFGIGKPSKDFPLPWAIYSWIEGKNPTTLDVSDLMIHDLVAFIRALQHVNLSNGPISNRGVPLEKRNIKTREAIGKLKEMIDLKLITGLWENALQIPKWEGKPIWVHGDLSAGNLLIKDERLIAVIDFGIMGVGDPACDLIIAWNLLPSSKRELFRSELKVDDATWLRGKAWALSIALIQLPYYKITNPVLANNARYVIQEVIQEGLSY